MESSKQPLFVTRPVLPPLEQLIPLLQDIWQRAVLTNGGPYHERFEAALATYLGVPYVSLVTNATIALIVALRQQNISGEVITTPFSFAATAHAIKWCGAEPVFVDIDRSTLNLDPARIEAAITSRTTAIMPVHCYGHPCDVEAIERIANRHGLRVIYDAAHAFGVRLGEQSLLLHGDLAVVSFHATKVFNTFEGGAVVCKDAETRYGIEQLKNFGIVDEEHVDAIGLNGKMSEFTAALGLLQLDGVDNAITRRREVYARYRSALAEVPHITFVESGNPDHHNFAYCPILIGSQFPLSRDAVYEHLRREGINARRYFFPLLSSLPMYRATPSAAPHRLPVASLVSEQVLCLPIYPDLSIADQARVTDAIRSVHR